MLYLVDLKRFKTLLVKVIVEYHWMRDRVSEGLEMALFGILRHVLYWYTELYLIFLILMSFDSIIYIIYRLDSVNILMPKNVKGIK